MTDEQAARAYGVCVRAIGNLRRRLVEEGLEAALGRKKQALAKPIPAAPGCVEAYDYEYVRNGTANPFIFVEPLRGWRHVNVTRRRTKLDFAGQMEELVDVHCPKAQKVTLVMDNLNTHRLSCLYEAFAPEEARRIIKKIEVVHTPKHGSWLNMAECELSVL